MKNNNNNNKIKIKELLTMQEVKKTTTRGLVLLFIKTLKH